VIIAYRRAAASLLAPFSYCQLISSALLGFLVFGAAPDIWTLVGGGVIIGSGIYTAYRERARARQRSARRQPEPHIFRKNAHA
jgi:drug/metabolite transporter (DMT)-like permease